MLIVGGSLLILITTFTGWMFGPATDVLPAALYLLFAVAMRVPLPTGPLEPFLRGF